MSLRCYQCSREGVELLTPERTMLVFHSFFTAISWNIINVFLYKIILQAHQACLFLAISQELFGLSGTLFSSIYFLISITNVGFDYFIITHHQMYTHSKESFKKLLPLFLVRMGCSTLALGLLYTLNKFTYIQPIHFLTNQTSVTMLAILIIIFMSESIKKSLDILAQMSFLQKSITLFDISTLLLYLLFVWGSYFATGFISLYTIFVPMCMISIIECLLLFLRLRTYYKTLPVDTAQSSSSLPSKKTILQQQAMNYINQITKALFSPNFFIIVLAYNLGMTKAGYIKLFTDIIILLYMLLNRSFGLPSAALFSSLAQHANPTHLNTEMIKHTFIRITNWYIQFLYALGITLFAVMVPYLLAQSHASSVITFNIIVFVFAGFIEYLIISYEKWYLTQNKAWILATMNTISLIPYALLLYCASLMQPTLILAPIVGIRLLTLIIIIYVTYRKWNIMPSWKIEMPTIFISATTISIALCWHYV